MNIISREEARRANLKRFFTGIPCIRGHIVERNTKSGACIQCDNERSKNRDQTQHRETSARWAKENAEYRKEHQRATWPERKKKNAQWRKEYYTKTKERQIAKAVENYKANREARNKAASERLRKNPIKKIARCLLQIVLKKVKEQKIDRTETILGYTFDDFRLHLEKQFKPGMTWANHGEWHIDHIKPISVFVKEGISDMRVINALSNLQPLWAKDNLSKQAKWENENV